ncbi:MAG: hypothetical protein A2057_03020 [Ignavibacteria bacterium GWA2_35_9]|nr:MAG: hypothetical protein A2057_03020 [Ignavibacteria bacterium GWA2_35_9]OGU51179.1 MAG: hypothetical protein A2080_15330 [Ignavibacteria bacterium GWC2_36_12]
MKRSKQLTSVLNPFLSIFLNCVQNINTKQQYPFTIKIKYKIYSILLWLLLACNMHSQIFHINGNISANSIPVSYASITFMDRDDTSRKYSTITDSSGNYYLNIITSISSEKNLPTSFELEQNYPNPFSNETAISYKLNKQSDVQVAIYDILGREVKTYSAKQQGAGIYGMTWDGKNNLGMRVSSGVYLYMVKTGNETQVKKMIFNHNTNISAPLQIQNSMLEKSTGNEIVTVDVGTYKVTVKSDTNTTPLIVIQEFPNQQIDSDTTLNYEVEKARILIGQSIDDVKLGDDSLTVIISFGEPDEIWVGDFDGYFYEYLNQDKTLKLRISFMPSSDPKVTVITICKGYDGKTKDGIGVGIHRDSVLKLLGTPFYTYSGDSIIDNYLLDPLPGYLNSQIYIYYDVNNILGCITMMTRD